MQRQREEKSRKAEVKLSKVLVRVECKGMAMRGVATISKGKVRSGKGKAM